MPSGSAGGTGARPDAPGPGWLRAYLRRARRVAASGGRTDRSAGASRTPGLTAGVEVEAICADALEVALRIDLAVERTRSRLAVVPT